MPETWVHHGAAGTPTLATLLAYERYHVRTLGWRALGYSHAVAEPFVDGFATVYVGRDWGREGGHTSGHNRTSHGVLLVGDWTSRAVPLPMVRSMAWLVRDGHQRVGATRLIITGGHRQAPLSISTACPGNAGMAAIPPARALLTGAPPPAPEEGLVRMFVGLERGMPRNGNVALLQRVLNRLGSSLEVDGRYGPATAREVARVTRRQGDQVEALESFRIVEAWIASHGGSGGGLTQAQADGRYAPARHEHAVTGKAS